MEEARSLLTPAGAFEFLLGAWTVERELSGQAEMAGFAEVRRTANGEAEFHERVTVRTLRGAEFTGSQRYLLQKTARGFALLFAEGGRVFEDVQLGVGADGVLRGSARHECGEDVYDSEYVLGPGESFSICHRVVGPRKDYVSVSRFVRACADVSYSEGRIAGR